MNNIEAELLYTPTITWKLEGLRGGDYGTVKGPTFDFLGAKWKLKFVYCICPGGDKTYLLLKMNGIPTEGMKLQVTTNLKPGNYYTSVTSLVNLKGGKWIIWEQHVHEFRNIGSLNALNQYYLECIFTIDTTAPQLKTNNIQPDSKFAAYSPCIESLCQNFGSLYNNIQLSDVILECEGKKIYAHRIILAARSEVFAGMFRNDMSETIKGHVQIEDLEPLILEKMVRYLYSGDAGEIDLKTAPKLYAAADKYCVDSLKMQCGTIMVEKKQPDSKSDNVVNISSAYDDGINSVRLHFNLIKNLLETKEWKKLAEKEPKFAFKAFQYFVRESPA